VTTPPTTVKPEPTPTPVQTKSCTLEELPPHDDCAESRRNPSVFVGDVQNAIEILRQQKPDYFNGKEIRQVTKYVEGLMRVLTEEYGYCTARNGKDEIKVKNTNNFSEHYDVVASGREGGSYVNWSYTATCNPADF
jgi:hypothetical protein